MIKNQTRQTKIEIETESKIKKARAQFIKKKKRKKAKEQEARVISVPWSVQGSCLINLIEPRRDEYNRVDPIEHCLAIDFGLGVVTFFTFGVWIEKKMNGWERVRSSRSRLGQSSNGHQRMPSRTVTLGRVQPQAPGNRNIHCNDREANQPLRFKVYLFLYLFSFRTYLSIICIKR